MTVIDLFSFPLFNVDSDIFSELIIRSTISHVRLESANSPCRGYFWVFVLADFEIIEDRIVAW